MGNEYQDVDEIYKYLKTLSIDDKLDDTFHTFIDVDENLIGPDVLKKVEKVHDQIISA